MRRSGLGAEREHAAFLGWPARPAVPGIFRNAGGSRNDESDRRHGFLVAFANRNDMHHAWAVGLAKQVTEPLLTCEAVLAETAFHLRNADLALAMVREGLVTVSFACAEHIEQLAALARRFADRTPDLADLCLIRMSEMNPKHSYYF